MSDKTNVWRKLQKVSSILTLVLERSLYIFSRFDTLGCNGVTIEHREGSSPSVSTNFFGALAHLGER